MKAGSDLDRVTSYTETKAQKSKPLPLNTVEMLKIASSNLGMSPNQTMHIAENLYPSSSSYFYHFRYIQGYISYPRTESSSYPVHFDLQATLKKQMAGD
jgi:DNA topoisomerase-3